MPKLSRRKKAIKHLSRVCNARVLEQFQRDGDSSDDSASDSDDSLEDDLDSSFAAHLREVCNRRYLFRGKYRRAEKMRKIFEDDLQDKEIDGKPPWLKPDEFKQKYRVDRESFQLILDEIKDHRVFKKRDKGRRQTDVKIQLLIFLYFLGVEGSGGSNNGMRNTFGVSYGFADDCRTRVAKAICSLKSKYVYWPDEEERKEISRAFYNTSDISNCIGVIDGTLFPLASEPQCEDAPEYSGRKFRYSISCLIVNDHKRRIRHYLGGFPGTAHDNRIWEATELFKNPDAFFFVGQFLLGDSAFGNGHIMVSSYKKPLRASMPDLHEQFNTHLAKARISSEHTIGMLKCRFPWLRSIRLLLTEDKRSMRNILRHLDASVILHNMLIDFNDTCDDLPPDDDDYVPHPNDVFDVRVGQEIVWDETTDTRANLLGHLVDMKAIN